MRDKNGRDEFSKSYVPETPEIGRSKRRSTLLSSAATKSLIMQQKQTETFDSPTHSRERTVVEETPELNPPENHPKVDDQPVKPKGGRKGRPLPSIIPSENTFVQQSKEVLSSTVNTETTPVQTGGSSSRRKKGKPFKIVQWNEVQKDVNLLDSNSVVNPPTVPSESAQSSLKTENLPKRGEGKNGTPRIDVSESKREPWIDSPSDYVSSVKKGEKSNLEIMTEFLEQSYLEEPDEKSTKKKEMSYAKYRRLSRFNSEDFVKYICDKEKSPSSKTAVDLIHESEDEEDDGWEVVKNDDGSIKKYLPKSNRKSIVISGNLKSKTKNQLNGGKTKEPPRSRKNLSRELDENAPVNSTFVGQQSSKSRRLSSISQLSGINTTALNESSKEVTSNSVDKGKLKDIQTTNGRKERSSPKLKDTSKNAINQSDPEAGDSTVSISGGYAGLSFQNFSTESAKEMISMLEKKGWDSLEVKRMIEKSKQKESNNLPGSGVKGLSSGRKSQKRKTDEADDEQIRNKRMKSSTEENLNKSTNIKDVTPQRAKPVFPKSVKKGEKTSFSPMPMELCESPTRRSGRKSTQISTLASDGLARSPLVAKQAGQSSPVVGSSTSSTFAKPHSPSAAARTPRQASEVEKMEDLNESVDDLPATQAAPLFEGLVFFVEIRDGRHNRSKCFQSRVMKFGGTVSEKISRKVTHVIFSQGTRSNYLKAKKLNLPILSIMWVEESIKAGKLVPVGKYPSNSLKDYDMGKFPSLRKLKSYTLPTEEERAKLHEARIKRKQKKLEAERKKEEERQKLLDVPKYVPLHPLHYEGSPYIQPKEDTVLRILKAIKSPSGSPLRWDYMEPSSLPPWEDEEEELDLSLADRIIYRYNKNKALDKANQLKNDTPETATKSDSRTSIETTALETPKRNITQSSSLDTTKKPRKAAKLNESSSLVKSPILESTKISGAAEGDFQIRRRSGRQSTQISTKASVQLASQEKTPQKSQNTNDQEDHSVTEKKTEDDLPPKKGSKTALESSAIKSKEKQYKDLPRKMNEQTEKDDGNTPKKALQRKAEKNGNEHEKDPIDNSDTRKKKGAERLKNGQDLQAGQIKSKTRETRRGRRPKNVDLELEKAKDGNFGAPRLESTRLSVSVPEPSTKSSKPAVQSENDKLFDALLQSSFTGRKSSDSAKKKLGSPVQRSEPTPVPDTSRLTKPATSPQRPGSSPRPSSSPRHHSSSARQWLSLAPPRNQIRSPQRPTSGTLPTSVSGSSSQDSGRQSTTNLTKPSTQNISSSPNSSRQPTASSTKPSTLNGSRLPNSNRPMITDSAKPSSQTTSDFRLSTSPPEKKSKVVAPWRKTTSQNEETKKNGSSSQDVYEFEGFPDEPETAASKVRRIKSNPAQGRVCKFGRPSQVKMFLVAPKRKSDEGGQQAANTAASEKSPTRPVESVSRYEISPSRLLNFERGSIHPEVSSSVGDPANQQSVVLTEEPRKAEKRVVLSKVFNKPPSKDTDETNIDGKVDGKEKRGRKSKAKIDEVLPVVRSGGEQAAAAPTQSSNSQKRKDEIKSKRHKLFSQTVLDETASNSPVQTIDSIENVHESNSKTKSVMKSKTSKVEKSSDKSGSQEFKKPRELKKTQRRRQKSSESDDRDRDTDSQSDSDHATASSKLKQKRKKTTQQSAGKLTRRSSMDFAPLPRFIQKMEERKSQDKSQNASGSRSRRKGAGPLKNIVCTSCSQDDISLVHQLIKSFGRFAFSTAVNSRTSHVISGEGKRTLNLLKGLLQGCWLVTKEWLLASLENGDWVDEEPYEMVDFSPAVRNLRIERSTWGSSFKSELFKEIETIYISPECRAPRDELRQLVQAGGGLVSHQARIAKVVVGEPSEEGVHQVTEKWILDSVQFHVIMPYSDYPL